MQTISFLQAITYISYIFILAVYGWRTIKYARMPVHLRWDLYPMPGEKGREYGGSYLEELEWWTKTRPSGLFRSIVYIVKDYISFMQYYHQNKPYWFVLYPLHIGFYLVFLSHVFFFFGGLALVTGLTVSADSASLVAKIIYYATFVFSIGGCVAGSIGCIGLLVKRSTDRDLRPYSPPMYYFNYLFFLSVFISGLYSWYFFDPDFSAFREFWRSLLTFTSIEVDWASAVHIVLFSLFLIYMPFTRAMHYITKFFTFFAVRWNDRPNVRGGKLEQKLQRSLEKRVSWSASHIQAGKKWSEIAVERPEGHGK